jgi:putative transposase
MFKINFCCVVLLLFPTLADLPYMARLNKTKVRKIIKQKQYGLPSKLIARQLGFSKRRINQVWKYYEDTGKLLEIKKSGKEKDRLPTKEEIDLILKIQKEQGCGARIIGKILRRKYNKHVGNNLIHMVLLENQLATPNENKQKRRKPWVMYERKHSLSAGHIDWHPCDWRNGYVCVILDDSSRKVLSGCESNRISGEKSISLVKEVLDRYGNIRRIREIITDRGSEFYTTMKKGAVMKGQSDFEKFLEKEGIKHILCRYKHPQTNGKLEKWFDTYEKHRKKFKTFDEFVKWYDEVKVHESLDLETPEKIFWLRLREYIFEKAVRLFGW